MDKWIHSIVDKKIEQGEFSKSKRDLYIYGYTLLLEKTIIILITITIAVIFKAYWEIIILCIAFIPLRQYAGGYHAKTRSACLTLSALYMIGAVLWIGFAKNHLIFPYNVLIEGVCAGIVFWLAPIDTQTRRISESERIYFKRVTRIILIIQSAIVIALICFQKNQIVTIILTGHMGVAGSLMIGGSFRDKQRHAKDKKNRTSYMYHTGSSNLLLLRSASMHHYGRGKNWKTNRGV